MKYQEGLKETKDFLKTTPEPQIREICNQAGLTERETEMIVQKFRKGKENGRRKLQSFGYCFSNGKT